MRRQVIAYYKRILIPALLLIAFFFTRPALAYDWKSIAPGVDYVDIGYSLLTPWSHIHVFRVDLKQNHLDLVMAKALSQRYASVEEIARFSKALISINGGFFDRKYQPLGLRISHRKKHNPSKRISWWGIFYIKDDIPYLARLSQYDTTKEVDFAIQSGPRLIINNRIPSLKNGLAERSALGITADKSVIILVTESHPLTTTSLAHLMQSPPLNCTNALNLDGGSSSQLYAKRGDFSINVHGFSNITDAIIVQPKQ